MTATDPGENSLERRCEDNTLERLEYVSAVWMVSAVDEVATDEPDDVVSADANARARRATGVDKCVVSGIDVPSGANTKTSSPGKSALSRAKARIHRIGIDIACCGFGKNDPERGQRRKKIEGVVRGIGRKNRSGNGRAKRDRWSGVNKGSD